MKTDSTRAIKTFQTGLVFRNLEYGKIYGFIEFNRRLVRTVECVTPLPIGWNVIKSHLLKS